MINKQLDSTLIANLYVKMSYFEQVKILVLTSLNWDRWFFYVYPNVSICHHEKALSEDDGQILFWKSHQTAGNATLGAAVKSSLCQVHGRNAEGCSAQISSNHSPRWRLAKPQNQWVNGEREVASFSSRGMISFAECAAEKLFGWAELVMREAATANSTSALAATRFAALKWINTREHWKRSLWQSKK